MNGNLPQGAFLLAIANEIDMQLVLARKQHPDRTVEFDRIASNTSLMREKADMVAGMSLEDIPDEELISIRDLLVSTIDMAKAFGQEGQRLQ